MDLLKRSNSIFDMVPWPPHNDGFISLFDVYPYSQMKSRFIRAFFKWSELPFIEEQWFQIRFLAYIKINDVSIWEIGGILSRFSYTFCTMFCLFICFIKNIISKL